MDEKRATERRLEEFFRARLSIRSSDGDDRAAPGASPSGSQLTERNQRIGDDKGRKSEAHNTLGIVNYEGSRACITCLSKEHVRVMIFATQRDKEIAALDGARVGRDPAKGLRRSRPGAQRARNALQRPVRMRVLRRHRRHRLECRSRRRERGHGRTPVSAESSATISRSSKGYEVVPRIWYVS